jgi:hypothetical protein
MLKQFPAYSIRNNINNLANLQYELKIPIHVYSVNSVKNNKVLDELLYDTHMHIELLRKISRSREKGVLIFENNVFVKSKDSLINFVKAVKEFTDEDKERGWHILLLGSESYSNSRYLTHKIKRVNNFWGANGFYIKSEAIPSIIDTFEKYNSKGFFLPINWLYEKVMEEKKLVVYGPSEPDMFLYTKN